MARETKTLKGCFCNQLEWDSRKKAGKVEENLQGLLKWPWATWQGEDHKPKPQ